MKNSQVLRPKDSCMYEFISIMHNLFTAFGDIGGYSLLSQRFLKDSVHVAVQNGLSLIWKE